MNENGEIIEKFREVIKRETYFLMYVRVYIQLIVFTRCRLNYFSRSILQYRSHYICAFVKVIKLLLSCVYSAFHIRMNPFSGSVSPNSLPLCILLASTTTFCVLNTLLLRESFSVKVGNKMRDCLESPAVDTDSVPLSVDGESPGTSTSSCRP